MADTPVAPRKWRPLIVTVDPTGPLEGVKPVITGEVTMNAPSETPVPAGVVTRQRPSQAPAGTWAVTVVADTTVKLVETKHKLTVVAPIKFQPLIVTVEPT